MGLAFPGRHARHDSALEAPSSGLYVPEGHGANVWLALAAPTDAQKPPTGQRLHVDAPGLEL